MNQEPYIRYKNTLYEVIGKRALILMQPGMRIECSVDNVEKTIDKYSKVKVRDYKHLNI